MCFSPQRRAIFEHLNFKKCSEPLSFFSIFTSKCASRHSGVQFLNISTSKSGPNLTCFVHFHFKMCFSPQRRAIFQHLNFKKWSENVSFLAFSLENVLLATAVCNFWFLLWPHDSAPAALTSLLFDSPDTRIIGKTQRFATSLTFGADASSFFWLSRYCIFFLLTLLHLLTLLSSDFTSSICFSSAFQLSILSEVYYLNFLRSESQKNMLRSGETVLDRGPSYCATDSKVHHIPYNERFLEWHEKQKADHLFSGSPTSFLVIRFLCVWSRGCLEVPRVEFFFFF